MVPVQVSDLSFHFESFTVSQAFDFESLSSTDQYNFLIKTLLQIRIEQFGWNKNYHCGINDKFYIVSDRDTSESTFSYFFFNVLDYKKHIVPLSGDSSLVLYSLCLLQNSGFTQIHKEQNIFEARVDFINFSRRPNVLPGLEGNVSFDSSERVFIHSYFQTYFYQNKARLMDEVIKTINLIEPYFDLDVFKRVF
jgi:hypothetical protein